MDQGVGHECAYRLVTVAFDGAEDLQEGGVEAAAEALAESVHQLDALVRRAELGEAVDQLARGAVPVGLLGGGHGGSGFRRHRPRHSQTSSMISCSVRDPGSVSIEIVPSDPVTT